MIGASLLLLIGVSQLPEADGNKMEQAATSVRPSPASATVPQLQRKRERRVRAVRRNRTNDITETLRAMSLMNIGLERSGEQSAQPNQ
jgi:hypothetical protein